MRPIEEVLFGIQATLVMEAVDSLPVEQRIVKEGQVLKSVIVSRLLDTPGYQLSDRSTEMIVGWLVELEFMRLRGNCVYTRQGWTPGSISMYLEKEARRRLLATKADVLGIANFEGMAGFDYLLDGISAKTRREMNRFLRDELPSLALPEAIRALAQRLLEAKAEAEDAKQVLDRAKQVPSLLEALKDSARAQANLVRALGGDPPGR